MRDDTGKAKQSKSSHVDTNYRTAGFRVSGTTNSTNLGEGGIGGKVFFFFLIFSLRIFIFGIYLDLFNYTYFLASVNVKAMDGCRPVGNVGGSLVC